MKTISVTVYPFATQYGEIKVPENISDDELHDYIADHFEDIEFDPPELDYCGADFELP